MRKTLLLIILSILTIVSYAPAQTSVPQTTNKTDTLAKTTGPEMADKMVANGKIYIVVLVLATIFAGIIAYLIRLDLKIYKLEKK